MAESASYDRREMPARLSSPVLIGRVTEMAALMDALTRSEAGRSAVAIVGGEAGIGKSRLVAELVGRARDAGNLVLTGGCVSLGSDEGLPFAPIAEALRGLLRTLDRRDVDDLMDATTSELTRLVPDLRRPGVDRETDGPAEWAQTRLFEGFVALLERLGRRAPTVLLIEDLHWADRSTRELLAFVARRLGNERVLVVVTYRSDELHRRHPLRPWLAEMARISRVEMLALDRFDTSEIDRQLAAILGEAPAAALVDVIARRSEGNPFFAEELLAAGAASDPAILPARLRDVLLGRIGMLSEPAGRVLAAGAVAARAFDHDLIRDVLAMDEETLGAALTEAVSSQLLVVVGDDDGGTYAFRHALLGEALEDDLLGSERRRLHGAFAVALASRRTPDGAAGASHLAALAHHAASANDLPLALSASLSAARASTATSAFHEAAQAYERAVALWDVVPAADRPPREDHVELLYETSGALLTADEPRRARDALRLALAELDPTREPLRVARLEERLAWSVYLDNDLAAGVEILERAVARTDDRVPSVEAAGCLASLATFATYAGRYHDAIPIAERAIAVSRDAGAANREIEAKCALGAALAILGDCERGLAVLRDALADAQRRGEPTQIGTAYLTLASTLSDCDVLEESVTVGLEGSAWARGMRYPGFQAMAVEAMLPLGRWADARRILDDIPSDMVLGGYWNGTFAALLAVRTGRLSDARFLETIRHEARAMLSDAAFAGNLGGGLIELAIAEDRLDDARSLVDESLGWLAGADDVRYRSRLLRLGIVVESEIAAVARARQDRDRAERAVRDGQVHLAQLRELIDAHVLGSSPVFNEPRANLALAEAEVGRLLNRPDPEAWARAMEWFIEPRRPFELAWCRYRAAEAMLALRRPRSDVAGTLAEGWSIAEQIAARPLAEAIARLARIARIDLAVAEESIATAGSRVIAGSPDVEAPVPFGLTNREREVLVLLAEGLTNRRIADALFISESTASVHVSNIIGKLGVTNRVEAAAAAVRAGIAE